MDIHAIVYAHPYCARSLSWNITPRQMRESCAPAEETTLNTYTARSRCVNLLAVYFLKWSVTPTFSRQKALLIFDSL